MSFCLCVCFFFFFFFLMIRRPPRSTLFPTRRSSDLPGRREVGLGRLPRRGSERSRRQPHPPPPPLRAVPRRLDPVVAARAELLERYQALPLPTTKDEHWRFTDLKGFDPDSWGANGGGGGSGGAWGGG